jgi:hypothetical protein
MIPRNGLSRLQSRDLSLHFFSELDVYKSTRSCHFPAPLNSRTAIVLDRDKLFIRDKITLLFNMCGLRKWLLVDLEEKEGA